MPPKLTTASKILSSLVSHGSTPSLVSRSPSLSYTHLSLARRAVAVSLGLSSLGFTPGSKIATCLGNTADNVTLQLAASFAAVSTITCKVPSAIPRAAEAMDCIGSANDQSRDGLIISGGTERVSLAVLVSQFEADARNYVTDFPEFKEEARFYYGTLDESRSVSLTELYEQGEATKALAALTAADSVCLPLSLNHSMGFGFGVLSAVSAGARVVLPADGVEGDAMKAMVEEKCSVLFADDHTYRALPSKPTAWARRGVVKIGAGNGFNEGGEERKWGAVPFVTVGTPK